MSLQARGPIDPDTQHSALGKAQLAFLHLDEVRYLMKRWGMKKYTPDTVTSLSAPQAELKRIRSAGFALDDQESWLGAFCVAAPILNGAKHPVAAISIPGPIVRFNQSHLSKVSAALLSASAETEQKLGR